MKYFTFHYACLALLAFCINTAALSQEAKWTPFSPDNYFKEGDGYFEGSGVAVARFSTCAIAMTLREKEKLSVKPLSPSILIRYIYSDEGYSGSYGLGCYTGEDLEKIRAEFSAPDGSLGLSAHKLERRQEYPQINTSAIFFNGKNWQGVGITEDFWNSDDPIQNMDFCLFGQQQALCGFAATVRHFADPNSKTPDTLFEQLKRIEFLEPEK